MLMDKLVRHLYIILGGLVNWYTISILTQTLHSSLCFQIDSRLYHLLMAFLLSEILYSIFVSVILATLVSILRARKYKLPPGPIPVPIFGNWLQIGDNLNHRKLTELAKTYGHIFLLRMGQRTIVVVSSPELAKDVLQTQGVQFGSHSRNIVMDVLTGKGQDLLYTVYGEHWRKMRRITTTSLFTKKVVQLNRVVWEDEAARMVEDVMKNPKAAREGVVIRKRIRLMIYNNLYMLMYNKRFEREDDELLLRIRELNEKRVMLLQSFKYNYGDFIPFLRPLCSGYLKLCKDVQKRRLNLFKDYFLDERKKVVSTKGSNKCAIDHILEAEQKGEINEDNVLYLLENINVGGIDTILWTCEWAMGEIVNNPRIQKKLRDELDSVVGKGVVVTVPDLEKLPYLNAVIKETLRLKMPNPLLVPHMNICHAKLAGYDIPAESKIYVNAWWLANNPDLWKKPEEFRPERFLEEELNVEPNGEDFRYVPFGAGRRICPGIVLALPIARIIVGTLVHNFELLPPPGQDKIDLTERFGQSSMTMMTYCTIVLKPRSF